MFMPTYDAYILWIEERGKGWRALEFTSLEEIDDWRGSHQRVWLNAERIEVTRRVPLPSTEERDARAAAGDAEVTVFLR
jgi:hypothetical protein